MDNPGKRALEHELQLCIDIEAQQVMDINQAYMEFAKDQTLANAYSLRKFLSGWINTRDRYDQFKKIHDAGWGQEDTKHE